MAIYASNAGKSGGEFFTPADISKLGTVGKSEVNKVYINKVYINKVYIKKFKNRKGCLKHYEKP